MPIVELIAIGTELLLGDIQDTNTRYIARYLRDFGIDLYRSSMIGDNTVRIAQAVREACQRADIVITTGGLGPTVDDPTREAIAKAVGVTLEFREELWDQILVRFKKYGRIATENNRRQAQIPLGAIPIENEVGTAPAFIFEIDNSSIICLPGVPREMEYILESKIMPYLKERFHLNEKIVTRVLHTAGVGESQVDEWIGDLETSINPTVGLLAHPGQVDIRITAKADTVENAYLMISPLERIIFDRLGDSIYGTDNENLSEKLSELLFSKGWSHIIVVCGFGQDAIFTGANRNREISFPQVVFESLDMDNLIEKLSLVKRDKGCDCCFGVSIILEPGSITLNLAANTPENVVRSARMYGGPPANALFWGENMALDFFHRSIGN